MVTFDPRPEGRGFVGRRVSIISFPGGSVVKNLPANAGDAGNASSIPGLGRSPGGGNGNSLQYSCLENPMDRGAWQATVHEVAKSRTSLKQLSMHIPKRRAFNRDEEKTDGNER